MSAPLRCWVWGIFAFQERIHLLERCNTLDFVPKSCAKGAATPLESLLTSPVGDVDSPDRKLSQRCTGLSAARKRHFCGSVITHYERFQPCGLQSVVGSPSGKRLYRVRFGQIAAYVRTNLSYARTQ